MKYFKTFFISTLIMLSCNLTANAITPKESVNSNYLNNHGHSQEIIDAVEMQTQRTQTNEIKEVSTTTPQKKSIWKYKFIDFKKPFGHGVLDEQL